MRLRRINRPKAALITAQQLLLIVVEKRGAVKRECTEAKRRVDSAKPNPQGAQASAREPQPSEFQTAPFRVHFPLKTPKSQFI